MSGIAKLFEALRAEPALRDALRHHEVLEARPPELAPLPAAYAALRPVLARRGIEALYSHQARALELLEGGANVALATPTASGKTLVYNLPVLRRMLDDPGARALYLFPLKALGQDQRQRLEEDMTALGARGRGLRVAIYDGDTPTAARRKLRADPPNVLITTPDMLHLGLLPYHANWSRFWAGLDTVVIDELHTYRGIFGSHVAQVLRRMQRVARFHGAHPRFVAASATIGNPGEIAAGLTGEPFEVVEADGAPRTRRDVLLLDPEVSAYTLATRLFRLAVGLGLRTIAFTKARKITELIHTWVLEAEPKLTGKISSYRAGFLPEERREIERQLFSGELLGVISTSALEMGIDVGALDVCLLVGYPGSQIATWQRAGRVGRERRAVIALIAQPDALDQYLMSHPRLLFERGFEHAVLDPENAEVLGAHLPCAAAEIPLREGEPWLAAAGPSGRVRALEDEGKLLRSEAGDAWFASRARPHRDVSLRSAGAAWTIYEEAEPGARQRVVGSVGGSRVFSECHEGAIYLHHARQFLVTRLEHELRSVHVRPVNVAWYTQARSEKDTEILERERTRPLGNARLVLGRVRVTTKITGYERRRVHGQELLAVEPLALPPQSFETQALWLEIPEEVAEAVAAAGGHPMGGLHASEHAALSLVPLFALCDRFDVAGISHRRHPQTEGPAIFFYDGAPGGVGLVASLFERAEALLEATAELVGECPCEEGCPACVQSPKCGAGNRPLDKAASARVLGLVLAREALPAPASERPAAPAAPAAAGSAPRAEPAAPRTLLFDLETQRSAEEVGGWHNAHLMRVALAVVYDAHAQRFETYREADVAGLLARLREADLVIGFNVRGFDYRVLRGYTDLDFERVATFDVLEAVHARLGFRVSLDHLARETLGAAKSANGLTSLRWWREGRIEEIERYCRDDVSILHRLFEHALREGHLIFRTKGGERVRIPARWSLDELVEQARARARRREGTQPRGRAALGAPVA